MSSMLDDWGADVISPRARNGGSGDCHGERLGDLEVLEPEDRVYYPMCLLDVDESSMRYLVQCKIDTARKGVGSSTGALFDDEASASGDVAADGETSEDGESTTEEKPAWVPRSCVSFRREPVSEQDFYARSQHRYSTGTAERSASVSQGVTLSTAASGYRFEPLIGDAVEVRCRETAVGPIGFRESYVNAVIDGFYHITYPDGSDEMVEQERIRPAGFRLPADFVKRRIEVPQRLRQDVYETRDTLDELCVSLEVERIYLDQKKSVSKTSKQAVESDQDEADGANSSSSSDDDIQYQPMDIVVIGERRQMLNVEQAVDMHFQRVGDFARLTGLQRVLNARLESAKIRRETAVSLVFEVGSDVIGSCIGKNGTHLKAAQRVPGVVSVRVDDLKDRAAHRFEILATTTEAAEEARDLVDHVRVRLKVTPDEIGALIGKKGIHLREIEQRAGVSKLILIERSDTRPRHAKLRASSTTTAAVASSEASSEADKSSETYDGDVDASSCSVEGQGGGGDEDELPYFETVGPRKQVALAAQLFNMHRTYLAKQRELESKVRELRDSLAELGAV
mmetsp:Transcript_5895/g.12398  ORF Transcript_5895/g.12398 Transcript_5895/m.12398 type:complete len:567 (+) Transcript_5895:219-1919(+)